MIGEGKLALRYAGGLHLLIPGARVTIGRGKGNHILVDDVLVSRSHAVVVVGEGGNAVLQDLGSANGIAVDGMPVEGSVVLRVGQRIQIGHFWLVVTRASRDDIVTLRELTRTLPPGRPEPAAEADGGATDHGMVVSTAMIESCERVTARQEWARAAILAGDAAAAIERAVSRGWS